MLKQFISSSLVFIFFLLVVSFSQMKVGIAAEKNENSISCVEALGSILKVLARDSHTVAHRLADDYVEQDALVTPLRSQRSFPVTRSLKEGISFWRFNADELNRNPVVSLKVPDRHLSTYIPYFQGTLTEVDNNALYYLPSSHFADSPNPYPYIRRPAPVPSSKANTFFNMDAYNRLNPYIFDPFHHSEVLMVTETRPFFGRYALDVAKVRSTFYMEPTQSMTTLTTYIEMGGEFSESYFRENFNNIIPKEASLLPFREETPRMNLRDAYSVLQSGKKPEREKNYFFKHTKVLLESGQVPGQLKRISMETPVSAFIDRRLFPYIWGVSKETVFGFPEETSSFDEVLSQVAQIAYYELKALKGSLDQAYLFAHAFSKETSDVMISKYGLKLHQVNVDGVNEQYLHYISLKEALRFSRVELSHPKVKALMDRFPDILDSEKALALLYREVQNRNSQLRTQAGLYLLRDFTRTTPESVESIVSNPEEAKKIAAYLDGQFHFQKKTDFDPIHESLRELPNSSIPSIVIPKQSYFKYLKENNALEVTLKFGEELEGSYPYTAGYLVQEAIVLPYYHQLLSLIEDGLASNLEDAIQFFKNHGKLISVSTKNKEMEAQLLNLAPSISWRYFQPTLTRIGSFQSTKDQLFASYGFNADQLEKLRKTMEAQLGDLTPRLRRKLNKIENENNLLKDPDLIFF